MRPRLRLQLAEELAGAIVHHPRLQELEGPEASGDLAAEEHIRRGGQIVAERKVLVDDLDPGLARLERLVEMHRPVLEHDLAGSRREVAGDDLDQRRLARAVVAHQAKHLAGLKLEIDLGQRLDRPEILGDLAQR